MDLAYENAFWGRVVNDHLEMLDERLAESEVQLHQRIHELRQRVNLDASIAFKQEILNQQLNGTIDLAEGPTTVSDMLNEEYEYKKILTGETSDARNPTNSDLDKHKLWLNDIVGHLDIIHNNLDGAAHADMKKAIHKMIKIFVMLRDENEAFICFTLNGAPPVSIYELFVERVIKETIGYLNFLKELYVLRKTNKVAGPLKPKIIDHMYREQSYYLTKLGRDEFREAAVKGLEA